jgi:hypothetical protein
VSQLLHSVSLRTVVISVDNAAANRKFYTEYLCGGTLQTKIIDKTTGLPIFLIFDPVHGLKNMYNNFQSRRAFQCPPMDKNIPDGCVADFQHIEDLFYHEENMSLKKAHRLKMAALNPKSIEKTSVQLAVSVFNESTRDALRFYGETDDKPSWLGTADFLALVIKVWNVLNVKTSSKGKHKRDITMDPVRSSDDWKLHFLREFADFLQRWEQSRKPGLTRETVLAMRHTCIAITECAVYLIDNLGFLYVLFGQLQSDWIESRFGWLRQLSGGNYFISAKQVLDSDRKIRAVSLLKFSGFSLAEIDVAIQESEAATNGKEAEAIAAQLTLPFQPSSSDANIIYYVGGYIGRSIARVTKCDDCKQILATSTVLEPPTIDDGEPEGPPSHFLEMISRGGLKHPSEYTFAMTQHCWKVYEELRLRPHLMKRLLRAQSQRKLFCEIVDITTYDDNIEDDQLRSCLCTSGHDVKAFISAKFFNCVAKNLAKNLTNKAAANDQDTRDFAKKRKLCKLSSATSART